MVEVEVKGEPFVLLHSGIPPVGALRRIPVPERLPWLRDNLKPEHLWVSQDPHEMPSVGPTVIMGHVPRRRPLDTGEVIAVDTGCATFPDGGRLTAVLLPERRFVTVGGA